MHSTAPALFAHKVSESGPSVKVLSEGRPPPADAPFGSAALQNKKKLADAACVAAQSALDACHCLRISTCVRCPVALHPSSMRKPAASMSPCLLLLLAGATLLLLPLGGAQPETPQAGMAGSDLQQLGLADFAPEGPADAPAASDAGPSRFGLAPGIGAPAGEDSEQRALAPPLHLAALYPAATSPCPTRGP